MKSLSMSLNFFENKAQSMPLPSGLSCVQDCSCYFKEVLDNKSFTTISFSTSHSPIKSGKKLLFSSAESPKIPFQVALSCEDTSLNSIFFRCW